MALLVVDVDWTPSRVALLVITPVAGTVIFSSVFVATSSITFWLVESTEFTAAFTYGGNYLATWPTSIFTTPVRRLFTFVIPAAFVDPPAPRRAVAAQAGECVELLHMSEFLDTPVRQLSLGQRMRGEVTAALLHSPELLVLDEPTIGLDLISKEQLRSFLVRGCRSATWR